MSEMATNFEPDSIAPDTPDSLPLGIGFVRTEPLDAMLRAERLPPPSLNIDVPSGASDPSRAQPVIANTSSLRLQAVKMRVDLAELLIAKHDEIVASGDAGAIEGLNEVNRFLVHCEHLRLLKEA